MSIAAKPLEEQVNVDTVNIIDVDSHVAEPPDLWTSRLPKRWADQAPHVEWDEAGGELRWRVGNAMLSAIGEFCTAGWHEHFPSHPPTLEDADPACYEREARLKTLNHHGILGQVLYPNLIGFEPHTFIEELGPELATECVRAYNDFLIDFADADRKRFIPIMMLPFWDVEASLREMHRARDLGHKGILFAALFKRIGFPNIDDPSWEPVLSAAQDLELSLNFHIGFITRRDRQASVKTWERRTKNALATRTNRLSFVSKGAVGFASSAEAIAEVILRGICHKYPRLKIVSVESGFGYFPYVLENMDWLWQTSGASAEFPDRETPSYYFFRQCYATFWHERASVPHLEQFQDNLMFETDFPHETGIAPGPASPAYTARETVQRNLASVSPEVLNKILYKNAATLYHMD